MKGCALVVDTDAVQLAITARAVTELGYDVRIASTFDDANRHLLVCDSLALLVSDVRLGQFNGIHLAFRARARYPQIQVVITHGDVFDATLAPEIAQLGGVYVAKLASASDLAAALAQMPQPPAQSRRWPRRRIAGEVPASVDDGSGRLVDVSYGGLCVEVAANTLESELPHEMDVRFPTFGLSLRMHPVWAKPAESSPAWMCGGEVVPADLMVWQQFVDACPS